MGLGTGKVRAQGSMTPHVGRAQGLPLKQLQAELQTRWFSNKTPIAIDR